MSDNSDNSETCKCINKTCHSDVLPCKTFQEQLTNQRVSSYGVIKNCHPQY